MAADETKVLPESYPMNGGDGKVSYARNSFAQRTAVDASKKFISEAIADLLDIEFDPILDSSIGFGIADLGCAAGPNTFYAVQNIIEAVDSKYAKQHQKSKALEYQVFFNDHVNNDFNTLFRTLPSPLRYFPVGVPGSFYGRLFPKDSVHLMHSSNSLNWLSRVPKSVGDINSPAWNADSIYCTGTVKEVVEAYSSQYKKDMENFLNARALELVGGGLLVLVLGGVPNSVTSSQTAIGKDYEILGSCLVDMANKGLISKEKVESFNLPIYYASPNEIEKLIQDNGCFSIVRMETFPGNRKHIYNSQMWTLIVRAGFEAIISNNFGSEMVEELFELYTKKHMDNVSIFSRDDVISLLHLNIVLKRKI
ncbi:S-adenosyl-L-methionine-dependent methyltransferases superfamily protein, putative [Theobroma cacao]|uniref:S-adenosyl-L-methionine-dependent methyltransferases superfamily protein, putative n=2 Tax=Theobroma cacao TaxID=3641 RepID=A0A061EGQ0_THECC|nr:S-adenosyl-L-methionine-dependent methyltransferases superfamily protein, putative [Theobroma cacao]